MSTLVQAQSRLSDYCERSVLPALYDRLDVAFPEFGWKRNATGWVGSLATGARQPDQVVFCRQPWGFVTQTGEPQSWLAYANGGGEPMDEAFVQTVRKLARLAGVDDLGLEQDFSAAEKTAATRRERSRQLFEAFASYAHLALTGPAGAAAAAYLCEHYGFTPDEIDELPVGFYTSRRDVVDYLTGVGFSEREILQARAMTDARLAGRLVVPWRDRWGNIQSVVAHSCADDLGDEPRRLYLKCGDLSEPFGLNVALSGEADGCENLVLVEDELAALLFHARGVANVASFGSAGRIPTADQWQTLHDFGVRNVTLAFHDHVAGYQRTRAAIETAHQAHRMPHLFALAHRGLGDARRPQDYLAARGVAAWQQLVEGRVHAYHFVARGILRQHKRGPWSDARLLETLVSALAFDAAVYRPPRELELDRFFWRVILEATSAYWPAVVYPLPHRKETLLRNRPGNWNTARCREQLHQLQAAMHGGDTQRFTNLIWAGACELAGLEAVPQKPLPVTPPSPRRPLSGNYRGPVVQHAKSCAAEPAPPTKEVAKTEPAERPLFTRADVRRMAYLMWEQDGRQLGRDEYYWFEAEQLLLRLGILEREP
ncbi:MAG: DUF2934 domain-containing protein [Planctomycetota bacterium]|nr:MAG: DUF2934 domain-containing protein [Planctomycetota bacterium]